MKNTRKEKTRPLFKTVEIRPGEFVITCEVSNRPFTRGTPAGNFCDPPEECFCEKQVGKSRKQFENLMKKLSKL